MTYKSSIATDKAFAITCVSNSCRMLFGIVAKLSNVGRGFILRCQRLLLLTINDILNLLESREGKQFSVINECKLIEFGFKKHISTGITGFEYSDPLNNTHYFTKNKFTIVQWGRHTPYYFSSNLLRVELKYVHKLQNLYYEINGEELI